MKLTDTRTQKFHPACDEATYTGAEIRAKYIAGWIARREGQGHMAYEANGEIVYLHAHGRTSPSNAFVRGFFDWETSFRWTLEPAGEMELSADEYLADL